MTDYRVGFRDLDEEVTDRVLPLDGDLPDWLDGRLLRNGPAKWSVADETGEPAAEADHWFDGLAHLTRFDFDGEAVRYTNRFLRTEAYREATERGAFAGQFSSSGGFLARLKSMIRGESTDNANVHVARLDGSYVALTETPRWVRFDPETLGVEGHVEYDDDLTLHHVTAHLRHDAEAGETWGFGTRFGPTSEYVVFRIPDGTARRERVATIEVDRPAYMHSFALTSQYVVLVEPPLVTHPAQFFRPGLDGFIDAYDWRPRRGTRVLVRSRADGARVASATLPAFFTFHTANAFRDGDAVVVDLVAYDDADVVTDLSMGALRGGDGESGDDGRDVFPDGELRRYRLPLESGGPSWRRLASAVELPRFSPDVHTEPSRYVFAQSMEMADGNALVRADAETDETATWEEAGLFAGEPVFVPRPTGREEADGVVLSLCLDADAERSVLLVLDGESFEEVARARLPHAVPFGFHGEYFEDGP